MKNKIFNLIIILIAIVAIFFGLYFYYKLHKIQSVTLLNDNQKENEVNTLITDISKLYFFPSDEKPTVATVSDPLALKSQAVFYLAQKGDKVLIFTKAGKAILYRPNINKIIDIVSVDTK